MSAIEINYLNAHNRNPSNEPKHRPWCGGLCFVGSSAAAPFVTMTGILALAGLVVPFTICAFTKIFWLLFFHIYFLVWTELCAWKTAFGDPGALLRAEKPVPKMKNARNSRLLRNTTPEFQAHFQLTSLGAVHQLKCCLTCQIVRPFRSSHCAICNSCFRRMDHHCPWLGTCVAQNNYKYFFFFLVHSFFLALYDAILCLYNFIDMLLEGNIAWGSIVLIIPIVVAMIFVGNLLLLHLWLITFNITTREAINGKFTNYKSPNPFHKPTFWSNFFDILFRSPSNNIRKTSSNFISELNDKLLFSSPNYKENIKSTSKIFPEEAKNDTLPGISWERSDRALAPIKSSKYTLSGMSIHPANHLQS